MTALAPVLRTALLHFVWQGLAVALILWIALFCLRRKSAQARYLVSCAGLAAMAVAPVVTGWLSYRAPEIGAPAATPAGVFTAALTTLMRSPALSESWMARLESWAVPVWAAGVLLCSLRLVWGCWRVALLRRCGVPAEAALREKVAAMSLRLGLTRPVRVLAAALPDGPSVAGWIRPVLLLPPAAVLGLTPEQLEAVLAHELAHIRRYDHLVNAAQSLIETVLFYHPAVWWVSARIREERELCCDDLAVKACGDALCFARALTRLERLRGLSPATALGSTGGSLQYRVRRLAGVAGECAPSKVSGILALSLGLGAFLLSVHWAQAQEPVSGLSGPWTVAFAVREGDDPGISIDLGGAAVMHRARVEYPEAVRMHGIQGTVSVEATLDAEGKVADARVIGGPMELRNAAMSSVLKWHFAPGSGTTRVVNIGFQPAAAVAQAGPVTRTSGDGLAVTVLGQAEARPLEPQAPNPNEVRLNEARERLTEQERQLVEIRSGMAENGATAGQVEELIHKTRPELNELQGGTEHPLRDGPPNGEEREALRRFQETGNRLAEQERELVAIRSGTAERGASAGQVEEQIAKTRRELGELQGGGEHPNGQEREAMRRFQGAGIKYGRLITSNLSDSLKEQLSERLPIRIGDMVNESVLKAVGDAIRSVDEHLRWFVSIGGDNTITITIHIEIPGR